MKKVTGKRVIAYILDYLVVAMIASLFARVQILNPQYDDYMKDYQEYTEAVKQSAKGEISTEDLTELSYNVAKRSVNISIITIVVSLVYFVGFQYLNKGQTLGKKILKIKMVDTSEDKLKIYQVLLNSAVINNLITSTISILFILYLKKGVYFKYSEVLSLVETGLLLGSLAFMIMRNDGKGLHDLIAHTNVVAETKQHDVVAEEK